MASCKDKSYHGCTPKISEDLIQDGWIQRFVGDDRMVRDSVENYEAMGFETKILPLEVDNLKEECGGCLVSLHKFSVVYTRKKV